MQVRLTLGDNSDAAPDTERLLLPGDGGQLDLRRFARMGTEAVKRNVRLGRRNTDFIEVLDGLEPGERVITSPYTSYVGMDRLTLD